LVVYDYRLAVIFALMFSGAFATLRTTVLPGLIAFACLPLAGMYLYWEPDPGRVVAITGLSALILLTHRKNLATEIFQLVERRNAHPKPHRHEL
jgi:hypothetical protein